MPRQSAASLAFPVLTRVDRLTPPAELSPDERQIFLDIVATTSANHFRPSDTPLLVAYCRAILLEREAAGHLATQGRVSTDNKLSAWVAIQTQATKSMLLFARALKLTPLARRPSPSRPGKPVTMNYYDRMRMERLAQTESDDGDDSA